MKGEKAVLEQLGLILENELTAINQYFMHARMLKNWGYLRLADVVHHEFVGEMKHADTITERILMLDDLPKPQDFGRLGIGQTVPEMFESDLKIETTNQSCLKNAVEVCGNQRDFVTRKIFENILEDTENHIDWLETQQHLIGETGLQNYLREQMFKGGDI